MIVVFWRPDYGQGFATSNLLAVSTMLSLDYRMKTLVTHTHPEKTSLESSFARLRSIDPLHEAYAGMDAVYRLIQCGKLSPQGVQENAESILSGRLDLLSGSSAADQRDFSRALPHFLDVARNQYDMTFVDVAPGTKQEATLKALEHADVIVVNLGQNVNMLDRFFKEGGPEVLAQRKNVLYCIGNYERQARLSKSRIAQLYRLRAERISVVPRNVKYMDGQNQRNIVDFLLRASHVKKRLFDFDEELYFVDSVRRFGKQLLAAVELTPSLEADDVVS